MRLPAPPSGLGHALFLVALAGFVDAVGYLALSGLFVSFMSGNSTQFAASLASGDGGMALAAGLLILPFLAGATAGALLEEGSPRFAAVLILAGEAVLLLAVVVLARGGVSVAHLWPLAFAMGAQNNLRQSVAGATLGSTFVTGALVSTGRGLARHLSGRAGASAWAPHLASWTALVVGAVLGGLVFLSAGLGPALAGPAAACAGLAALHLPRALRPPAVEIP